MQHIEYYDGRSAVGDDMSDSNREEVDPFFMRTWHYELDVYFFTTFLLSFFQEEQ